MITFPALRVRPSEYYFDAMPYVYASISGETMAGQIIEQLGTPWMCRVTYPNLDANDTDLMRAFLDRMRGMAEVTRLGDERRRTPRGTVTGAPLIMGAGQTGSTLALDGMTPGQTWAVGDYLEHSNTLHRVTVATTVNGSGQAALSIWPPVLTGTTDNAVVTIISPTTYFRLRNNFNPLVSAAPHLPGTSRGITLDFVESLP